MRCLPTIRVALGMTAFLPLSLCAAQTIDTTDQQRGSLELSSAATDARPIEPISLNEVHLNVVDQKLALSLAVDTWGQIAAGEAALPSIQSEALKRLLAERLETQRDFLKTLETLTGGRCCEAIEQAVGEIERDAKAEKPRGAKFRPLALSRNATAMIVRIRVEILQQYTAAINTQLANQSGEQFDRHFLRADLLNQLQMLAMLNVFAGQASDDFAAVIAAAAASAEKHLADSRQVLLQIDTLPSLAGQPAVPPVAGAVTGQ